MTLKEFADLEEASQIGDNVKLWSIASDTIREVAGELEYMVYRDGKARLLVKPHYDWDNRHQGRSKDHDLADLFPSEASAREALIQRKREQLEEVERVYGRKEKV